VTGLGFAFMFNERNSRLGAGVCVLLSAQEGALGCRKTIEWATMKKEKQRMMRTISTLIAVAIGVSAAIAQTDPIATRKALMKKNDEHERNLRRMVRAEAPFDAAKVNEAFSQWEDTAQRLSTLFPDNSKTGQDTRAMSKIWETRSDFEAKIAVWAKAIADNKDKANTLDELKIAYASVKTTCDNCHESYRAPSQRQPAKK
jgi:cytochrome c556